jgi:hypothetical protein
MDEKSLRILDQLCRVCRLVRSARRSLVLSLVRQILLWIPVRRQAVTGSLGLSDDT